MFALYINDLPSVIKLLFCFADDAELHNSNSECSYMVQSCIETDFNTVHDTLTSKSSVGLTDRDFRKLW